MHTITQIQTQAQKHKHTQDARAHKHTPIRTHAHSDSSLHIISYAQTNNETKKENTDKKANKQISSENRMPTITQVSCARCRHTVAESCPSTCTWFIHDSSKDNELVLVLSAFIDCFLSLSLSWRFVLVLTFISFFLFL